MENNGYIKLYRKLLDNPIICKDSDHFAIWIYLLLNATHDNYDVLFGGKRITLRGGQLITGRKKIAHDLHINESKVERVLKLLKIEHQIEQQTSAKNRLITILKWNDYQNSEQVNEQQVNSKRTTSEQQVNTNKNVKNVKNVKNKNIGEKSNRFIPPTYDEIKSYCDERKNGIDPQRFIDHYTANGWLIGGKSKMKDWKASIRTWESRQKYNGSSKRIEQITEYKNDVVQLSQEELDKLENDLKSLGVK